MVEPALTSLAEYQLTTSFDSAWVIKEELHLDLESINERVLACWNDLYLTARKSDDDPDEVDPGSGAPLTGSGGGPTLSWITFHSLPLLKSDDDPDEVDPGPGFTGGPGAPGGIWLKSDDDPDEVDPGPGFSGGSGLEALGRLVITHSSGMLKSDDDPDEVDPGPGLSGSGRGRTKMAFESDAPFDRRQAALLGWIAKSMAAEGFLATSTSWTAASH